MTAAQPPGEPVPEGRYAHPTPAPAGNADTWLIMPVYNEGPVVRSVIEGARTVFPNVVAIDDGSVDASAAEARAGGARVLRHPINLGQGAALQTGLEFALLDPGARYFVTFDSDGQHRVEDAARMVELLRTGEHEVLLGSRFLGTDTEVAPGRRLLLKAGAVFTRLTTGIALTDAHNGLRAFARPFAERVEITMPDMAHASELIAVVARTKVRYAEVPVTIDYTDYSRRKGQRSINSLNIAFDVSVDHLFGGARR